MAVIKELPTEELVYGALTCAGCGRTLAVRNNVVADVNVCFSPADMSASRKINSALVARVPH